MAERDPAKVQLDFPELTADLIRELRLTGVLGLLNLSDTVVPIISVGNVRPQVIRTDVASFDSAEVFSGSASVPAANAVVVDTGALPAGTYDVMFGGSSQAAQTSDSNFELQWRDAGNVANLATWPHAVQQGPNLSTQFSFGPTALNIGLNERLRWTMIIASAGFVAGWIMAAIRPTP